MRKLQQFEIQSYSGTLTDISAFNVNTSPLFTPPEIIELLDNVKIEIVKKSKTIPYSKGIYVSFSESERHWVEKIKIGDVINVTLESFDIFNQDVIVTEIEGLKLCLKKT